MILGSHSLFCYSPSKVVLATTVAVCNRTSPDGVYRLACRSSLRVDLSSQRPGFSQLNVVCGVDCRVWTCVYVAHVIIRSAEVAVGEHQFRTSSYCHSGGCVAVATLQGGRIGVRDTKTSSGGPILDFSAAAWSSFLTAVKSGAIDAPQP